MFPAAAYGLCMNPTRPIAFVVLALAAVVSLAGCEQDYPQESPEALVESARQMVLDRKARRLSDLVWTESEGERLVVDRLGRTMGALQRLGEAVSNEFPEEVEEIRKRADEAAESGEITSLIGRAMTAQVGAARGAPGAIRDRDRDRMRQGFDGVIRELMADPYGWLERHGDKLQPMRITDDIVALSWQGKPVVGLSLVEHDGKWYLKLPLDQPALRRFLPQTEEEFEIWAELAGTVHNVLQDLADEVERGEHKNLESVAASAGEYAFLPTVLVLVSYGKALEDRGSERESGEG